MSLGGLGLRENNDFYPKKVKTAKSVFCLLTVFIIESKLPKVNPFLLTFFKNFLDSANNDIGAGGARLYQSTTALAFCTPKPMTSSASALLP